MSRPALLFLIIFFLPFLAIGQDSSPRFPWAGGINSAQFCSIDLDQDGIPDLVIFDRHGNRIIPFINESPVPGEMHYRYAQEYSSSFPGLHDWVLMKDYDNDGKQDLFTYGLGGARVFRNVSDNVLRFELKTDLLSSFYYTGKVGILMTNVDYPGLADLDYDGDLDLLTFFGLGSYVEYHKNLSQEKYGNSDSLDFQLSDKCWGNFREGIESNEVELNVVCPYKNLPLSCVDGTRHTGSTFLVRDLNQDQLPDLILGDVDYPGIITLINGGTIDSAHMVTQDTIFPFASRPVRLFSFPAVSLLDIDNDDHQDVVISPFDPSLITSGNFRSCWYYHNDGSVFGFRKDRFFQDEMIDLGSGASPVFADLDGDGLTDLLAGNFGYYSSSWYTEGILYSSFISRLSYYRNTGSPTLPEFTLVTGDLASLSQLTTEGLHPACGDLDGDGKTDLVVGHRDGNLMFLRNTGIAGPLPSFESPVMNYQNIDPGEYSTPQLFDLDKDGLMDLIIGEKAGNLNYYRNIGTATNPSFSFVTDSLGKINVTNYQVSWDGYSAPFFFRGDDGVTRLVVGSEEGIVHYYMNIDGNLSGTFTPNDSLGILIKGESIDLDYGIRSSASVAVFSGPSPDLAVGNYSGGINYVSSSAAPRVVTGLDSPTGIQDYDYSVFPNPADDKIFITSESKAPVTASIYSLTGREIISQSFYRSAIIPVEKIANGLYILKISPLQTVTFHKPFIYKMMIQH